MFWSTSVNRLKHRVLVPDVASDGQPKTTRGCGSVVADDVPGEVGSNNDVIPFRITDLPLTKRIDVRIVQRQIGKFTLTNLTKNVAEESVGADNVRFVDTRHLQLLVASTREIKGKPSNALGCAPGDANGSHAPVLDHFDLAGVRVFGVFADNYVVDFACFPYLLQFAMNFVCDARIEFHGPNIRVEIKFLSIPDDLSETRQLRFRIWFAGLGENSFAIDVVAHGAQQNRVGGLAFFEGAVRPLGFVLDVVVPAAFNFFYLEIDA